MRRLSIRQLLFTLLSLGIVIAAIYSVGGYYLLKKETEKAIKMESLNQALYTAKEMAGLYDRITDAYKEHEAEMYNALKTSQQYFKENGRDASLETLKKKITKGRDEIIYEVFEINDQYVIDKTTYPNDLGLDFKLWKYPHQLLKEIYQNPGSIDLSIIIHSASFVDMRRFIVQRADNDNYLIQLGLTLSRDYLKQETIVTLQKKIPTLLNTKVYQVFGTVVAPKDVERWWMMEVHEHTGNPQIIQDDVTNEFTALIEPMLPRSQTFKTRKDRQEYFVELFKEKRYLDSYFWRGDQYIHRVVLPLSSRFGRYNGSISIIVIEFDESEGQHDLIVMNIMVFVLWVFLFLFTFLAVWLVRSRIISPLSILQKMMRENEEMPLVKIPNKRDEVGAISRAYNQLLDDVHREISSNKVLLQEFKTFSANAIHQIRTPLSVIKIALEMAESQNKEAEKQIKASLVSIEHMYDTLSYMVQYEKIDFVVEMIDLSALFEKRIEIFQVVADANDIRFDVNIEPSLYVMMNPTEAEYLIDNNLSNSIKFSKEGSVVSLSLRRSNDEIMLSFWNYGKAIRDVEAVFKRHVREDEQRSGSGIGLNMVDTICRQNKILIQVEYVNGQNNFSYFIEAM